MTTLHRFTFAIATVACAGLAAQGQAPPVAPPQATPVTPQATPVTPQATPVTPQATTVAPQATTVAPQATTVAPTNDAPNPYETQEGWAKMPAGRTWGATSAVEIDPDGQSVWVAERCGANRCWIDAEGK